MSGRHSKALGVRYFEELLTVCPYYVSHTTSEDIKPHKKKA